ncbi:MAG: DsbC family protein [Massilia sp.]
MLKMKIAALLAMTLLTSCVNAEPSPEATIRKAVEARLVPGAKIDSVKETPYAGLYEVRAGGDIMYSDKKGEFMIMGQIYNMKTGVNLTRQRMAELSKIKFSDLPLEMAIKYVKGNGKRVMAVFEDPNCSACKVFRKETIHKLDNVTVYTFLYNIISPASPEKSKNIWCSADRAKAWDDWMLNGKEPAVAPAACPSPNDKVFELGHKLGIQATPAIYFADGIRVDGAADLEMVEGKLASSKQ